MHAYIYGNWCLLSYLPVNVAGSSHAVVIFAVLSGVSNYVSLFYFNMHARLDSRAFWEYLNYKLYHVNFILSSTYDLKFCVLLFNLHINART